MPGCVFELTPEVGPGEVPPGVPVPDSPLDEFLPAPPLPNVTVTTEGGFWEDVAGGSAVVFFPFPTAVEGPASIF